MEERMKASNSCLAKASTCYDTLELQPKTITTYRNNISHQSRGRRECLTYNMINRSEGCLAYCITYREQHSMPCLNKPMNCTWLFFPLNSKIKKAGAHPCHNNIILRGIPLIINQNLFLLDWNPYVTASHKWNKYEFQWNNIKHTDLIRRQKPKTLPCIYHHGTIICKSVYMPIGHTWGYARINRGYIKVNL